MLNQGKSDLHQHHSFRLSLAFCLAQPSLLVSDPQLFTHCFLFIQLFQMATFKALKKINTASADVPDVLGKKTQDAEGQEL